MRIKRALEAYYEKVKTPEGVESDVLYRIEKERSRKWKKIALAEFAFFLLITGLSLYFFLTPSEYETMGAEEHVKVRLVKNVGLIDLSEDLSRYSLRIEGPYGNKDYFLIGSYDRIEDFLKNTDAFERLN